MSVMESATVERIFSLGKSPAIPFCSVCLEAVVEGEDRSIARLKCGHHFHLDCIGSAFNAKGSMQCPNCRQVEQGRWLYANAYCPPHEDIFEGLAFEEDLEIYSAASSELQVSHAPWCPHQGSYGHILLTFTELDNFSNGYDNPSENATQHMQVPGMRGVQIGPYFVGMLSVPLGSPLNHMESTSNRIGGRNASHGQHNRLDLSAFNSPWTSYGGSPQGRGHTGPFVRPSFRHLSLGFLMGSPQVAQAGYTSQHPSSFSRSGPAYTRRRANSDAFQSTQRAARNPPAERGMSEPYHGNGSFYSSGQSPSWAYHGGRMSRAAESSQVEACYSYGVPAPQWWAWGPHEIGSALQNMVPYTYPYQGPLSSRSSSMPTPPMGGPMEHSSGPHVWVFSGFQ